MDNLCHTLAGAALGKAGLARRTSLGMSTLLIASNLPDVDVAVFATNTLAMWFRRGWTHGVLAQAALPLLLAGAVALWGRWRGKGDLVRVGQLVLLSYVGVLSHVFLDWLNTYGVRLLMPFSNQWFYGDTLFVVDPWMYLALGAGVWLSRRRERGGRPAPQRPARVALAVAAGYIVVMMGATQAARAVVADGLVRGRPAAGPGRRGGSGGGHPRQRAGGAAGSGGAGGRAGTRFMVSPVVVNPFKREVVVDVGDRYEKGVVWFDPLPHFRPAGFGMGHGLTDPAVQQALDTPLARDFLVWSRFPFATVDTSTSPPRVWLNDYRYANTGPGGWSAAEISHR